MCGIAGIWNSRGRDAESGVVAMLDAMQHRGPDGRGVLAFEAGAAGMVRLALVDLSDRGQQPLWSADRRVAIVFNGEIYNFREERERLEQRPHQGGQSPFAARTAQKGTVPSGQTSQKGTVPGDQPQKGTVPDGYRFETTTDT